MPLHESLTLKRFPLTAKYSPEWMLAGYSGSANPVWLTEWLTEALDLRPGMRVLDLGCGRALSSIFLHREFDVRVWAADLWFNPSENFQRIRSAGAEGGVFPIQADARSLPFATEYFDAVVSIDSFFYYGTDDLYLNDIARFLKPGRPLAIAGAGLMHEFNDGTPPEHLREWWAQDRPWCIHSAAWWRRHWGRTGILDMETADDLKDGWRYWRAWVEAVAPDNAIELAALDADQGRTLGYVRAVGRRRGDALLTGPIASVPMAYVDKPMLRGPR